MASFDIQKIVREAIKDFAWQDRTSTTQKLIKRIETIASSYNNNGDGDGDGDGVGITLEQLKTKSLYDAQNLQNYEYIDFEKTIDITSATRVEFNGTEFLIYIDTANRIWAIFRRKLGKAILSNDAVELLSYLGAVYVVFTKKYNTNIDILPDNVVQISNITTHPIHTIHIRVYPKYLRGIFNDTDTKIDRDIDPFRKIGSYVEFINTDSEFLDNLPPNTKTIYINITYDTNGFNYINLMQLPFGIKNIYFDGMLFNQYFGHIPPTIEKLMIDELYSPLHDMPNSLQTLRINSVFMPTLCTKCSRYNPPLLIHCDLQSENGFCNECQEDKLTTAYEQNFNSIIFPESFIELILNICDSYSILKYITTIPKSFSKLILINYRLKLLFLCRNRHRRNKIILHL